MDMFIVVVYFFFFFFFLFGQKTNDPMAAFVPNCAGSIEKDGHEYLQLQNLLYGFKTPSVMDCKIGLRSVRQKKQ